MRNLCTIWLLAGLLLLSAGCRKQDVPEERVISRAEYGDRLYGFWLGQCIANWTGLVTEMDKIGNMGEIKVSLRIMDKHMDDINENIGIMNGQITNMTGLMSSMTAATHYINQGVSGMNQNIGRPMSFMNSIMPW